MEELADAKCEDAKKEAKARISALPTAGESVAAWTSANDLPNPMVCVKRMAVAHDAQLKGAIKVPKEGANAESTEEVVDARLQTAQLAPNEGTTAPRMAAQESVVSMDVVGRIEAEDSARFIDDIKLAVCPTANVSPSAILFIPPLVFVLPINVL
ncbi:unnamed protein product [Aphanomyces euteiches]